MIILTVRTDKPEAEIGLFDDGVQLAYKKWEANHKLSSTIHKELEVLLEMAHKDWQDLAGIICFKGPGSFTGLRIGLTVANVIAAVLSIPIVGTNHEGWINEGVKLLKTGENEQVAFPEYGRTAHITSQKR